MDILLYFIAFHSVFFFLISVLKWGFKMVILGSTWGPLGVLNGNVGDQNKFWFKMVMYWFKTFYLMSNMVELVSKIIQLWCQMESLKVKLCSKMVQLGSKMVGFGLLMVEWGQQW